MLYTMQFQSVASRCQIHGMEEVIGLIRFHAADSVKDLLNGTMSKFVTLQAIATHKCLQIMSSPQP